MDGQLAAARGQGPAAAGPDDPGGEGRADDPGRAGRGHRRPVAHHHLAAGVAAVGRRLGAHAQHPRGLGRHGRRVPGPGPADTARHPTRLRGRLGPRPRQPGRRDRVPAQHRPGRDPQPPAGRADRARDGHRDPGHRPPVGVRPVHLRGQGPALGPDLRELQREPGPGHQDGDGHRRLPGPPGRRAVPARPGAGHGQALRRRRRHRVRHRLRRLPHRPGHHRVQPARLRPHRPGAVRAGRGRAPCRQRHAVVLQRRLDRRPGSATRSRCTPTASSSPGC